MARGPGSVTGIPSVILHLRDGTTSEISGYGITQGGFSSLDPYSVFLHAEPTTTYLGVTYKFAKWNLAGVIPDGLDETSPDTTSKQYDDAYGSLTVSADYFEDESQYGTVVIEPSADPAAGGTASASITTWTGLVGSSFSSVLTATAKTRYAFVRWSDGGEKIHTITETVLSTGTRYVRPVAYFRMTSGLIVRSAKTPNLILRGSSNKILRDE